MTMTKLVIFGTGDIARLAHFYFERDSRFDVVGFTVDPAFHTASSFNGLPLVSFDAVHSVFPPSDFMMFVAISYAQMNQLRADRYTQAKSKGYTLASYVSTRATVLADEPVGDNCFILEDNTIQPFVRIGSNVTLWSGNHIGHDSSIGDHCFVASHVVVSGHVTIGPYCFLGVNATLRNGITVGARTLIGAGALVMKDTPDGSVFIAARTPADSRTSDLMGL